MLLRTAISLLAGLVLVPSLAFGQFLRPVEGSAYDTKEANEVLKDLDALGLECEEGTMKIRTGTETVQALVAKGKGGDFPVLTKKWKSIQAEADKLGKDARKKFLIKQEDLYLGELLQRTVAMEAFLKDPVKAADFKAKLSGPDKKELQGVNKGFKGLLKKHKASLKRTPTIVAKVPGVVAELGKQTAKDPLRSGDYQKLVKKLNKGEKKAQKVPQELDKQVNDIQKMLGIMKGIVD
jgi:hypothetical protein